MSSSVNSELALTFVVTMDLLIQLSSRDNLIPRNVEHGKLKSH